MNYLLMQAADNSTATADSFECDPNIQDCGLPKKGDFVAAHFFLWFLTFINGGGPILYWYFSFKPYLDKDPANKAILERNWWWFDTAWPMVVWGHTAMYGMPAFLGFFTWIGSKGLDGLYKWWLTTFMNYFGTIMHFLACLSFIAGAGFWVNQDLISQVRGWLVAGSYTGWTIITFIWIGSTQKKSFKYMYLNHCGDECYVETEAEPDLAVEIADTATVFSQWDMFDF